MKDVAGIKGRGDKARGEKLVLTACHPLYSAESRLVVWGRLVTAQPRRRAA